MFDILIIGSGPAGLTAGIYAQRANKKVGIVEGYEKCGQLMKTTFIENYPGFSNPISGPDLMIEMYNQAKNLNIEMIPGYLIDFEKIDNYFLVKLKNEEIKTKSLIIATGASPIMLGIEKNLLSKGISTCATCDGSFFKNKEVAVIGGGNTALEEAIYLSNIVKKIYIIHRRDQFRGEPILQNRMKSKNNIEILTPYEVIEFIGDNFLKGIKIKNTQTKQEKEIELQGAFVAIGHKPNTNFLEGKIELTENGYVKQQINTKILGLFVAGDVHDDKYRQAITAAGYGCMAALESIKYVENLD